ncbi:MAG: DUF523 and DUF1722 domain-containing protein [Pseudomonadota bacterium]
MMPTLQEDTPNPRKILIGISSCLLGNKVRFDGGHKRDAFINGTLTRYFEFVPFCPEVAIGLGIPRDPIRLVEDGDQGLRVLEVRNPTKDVTESLQRYSDDTTAALTHLSGYILKKGSPSCGMERVTVYSVEGHPLRQSGGIFAASLMRHQPLMPVEEEDRLGDPVLRDNFFERVFVYHRWQCLLMEGITPSRLVNFHSDHKLLIMSHGQAAYRRLEHIIATLKASPLNAVAGEYSVELMTTLKRKATRKSHTNVLQHLMGHLKKDLDRRDKLELLELIKSYLQGEVPLVVPITLLKHHFRQHPVPYIARQVYLSPNPTELMLRNSL